MEVLYLILLCCFLACSCNNHADSCHYNETLGHGVCDECQNGTTGYHCESCDDFHYRNISLPINDEKVCIGKNYIDVLKRAISFSWST